MEFVDDLDRRSPVGRVDLPPGVSVTRMILLSPGREDELGAMEGVDTAEFVANIVVARAVRKVLFGALAHIALMHLSAGYGSAQRTRPLLLPPFTRMRGRRLLGTSPSGGFYKVRVNDSCIRAHA